VLGSGDSGGEGGKGHVYAVVYGGISSAFEGVGEVTCLGEVWTIGLAPLDLVSILLVTPHYCLLYLPEGG